VQPFESGPGLRRDRHHPWLVRSVRVIAVVLVLGLLAAACGGDGTTPAALESLPETTPTAPDGPASTPSAPVELPPDVSPAAPIAAASELDLSVGSLPAELAPIAGVFSKHVSVWGVNIVATSATKNAKILHAANVTAQYLDNDADGVPDNQAVVDAMVANGAMLLMAPTVNELENVPGAGDVFDFVGTGGQDLYGSETAPAGDFDAALEEIHHLILNTGWAWVFPDQLAQAKGSAVAVAMDTARGGHFDTIPNPYPEGAWYTYDDETCDYRCMITEYTYWAHTSLLGAQQDRRSDIAQEWRLETAAKIRSGDPAVVAILEDSALGLPTVLPDGNYQSVPR